MEENRLPKISVVMPAYNTKEEYLREAIESILNQTYSDFEFIILNDGSTNNAEEVVLSYKDERIKYFKHDNMGIAKTLNRGLELAQGEYIARMDSDDISLPQRFEKQVNFLDNNPEYSLVGSWHNVFPGNYVNKHPEHINYLLLLKADFISHPTVMFRRNDFEKINLRYDANYKSEDYELWSRAIRCVNIYNMQEVLLSYRMEGQNISSVRNIFVDSDRRIRENMLNFLTDDEKLRELISRYLIDKKAKKFIEKIFSIRRSHMNKLYRIVTIFGFRFLIKDKKYLL